MQIGDLLLFVLASHGVTQILVRGRIFNGIRPRAEFFHCSMCVGFWIGMWMAIAMGYAGLLEHPSDPVSVCIFLLAMGGVTSGASYAITALINDGGLRVTKQEDEKMREE